MSAAAISREHYEDMRDSTCGGMAEDVLGLLDILVEIRRGYEEFYEGRADRLLNAEHLLREIGVKP